MTLSLITPSYHGDLERAALLFETVDRHVTGFDKHYVIVSDTDYPLFARFERGRREILPASRFLPTWLHPMPGFLKWRGRRYLWSLKAWPIYGWHTQQLVKIAAAATLPATRYCLIDSDNAFFRPFDAASVDGSGSVPLYVEPAAVQAASPWHAPWLKTAHHLLGLAPPTFPANDFIGQMIVWDQATVQAMLAGIERATRQPWAVALCKAHGFSEYMLYGTFVSTDATAASRHVQSSESLCVTHWDRSTPDHDALVEMLRAAAPDQVALCVQSFNATPIDVIRAAIEDVGVGASRSPRAVTGFGAP
ncbi:DUF6492 family protein [Lichenihabitans psoromatis]|uniref:DUF6492 family protein n=1 Tax=Lichenihabitans psoromatis TaxID=2528642 RepID=UPI0010385316|nr:DUF6492 family protein [Lichenihabitans psoromatis]